MKQEHYSKARLEHEKFIAQLERSKPTGWLSVEVAMNREWEDPQHRRTYDLLHKVTYYVKVDKSDDNDEEQWIIQNSSNVLEQMIRDLKEHNLKVEDYHH